VTIDEQFERKLLAIRAFTSPGQPHARLDPDQIESAARHWSRSGGGRYAEAFEVIRDAPLASVSNTQVTDSSRGRCPAGTVHQDQFTSTAHQYLA